MLTVQLKLFKGFWWRLFRLFFWM